MQNFYACWFYLWSLMSLLALEWQFKKKISFVSYLGVVSNLKGSSVNTTSAETRLWLVVGGTRLIGYVIFIFAKQKQVTILYVSNQIGQTTEGNRASGDSPAGKNERAWKAQNPTSGSRNAKNRPWDCANSPEKARIRTWVWENGQ